MLGTQLHAAKTTMPLFPHGEPALRMPHTRRFLLNPEQHRVACHHFSLKDTMAQSHVTCDLGTLTCHHFLEKSLDPEGIEERGSSQIWFCEIHAYGLDANLKGQQ